MISPEFAAVTAPEVCEAASAPILKRLASRFCRLKRLFPAIFSKFGNDLKIL